ncbi:SIS domain-containing protein [Ruegeria arenilitoris]|uniref:SIS domain-containing protein n=1 Tax=Ruegeria arenilitoris TaxID=1173585 RepID=UPI00147AF083
MQRPRGKVDAQTAAVGKDGCFQFMAKEMVEQPAVWIKAANYYLEHADGRQLLSSVDFEQFNWVVMLACGTAVLAWLAAKCWFEQIDRLPVEVNIASEFRYREPLISEAHWLFCQPVRREGRHVGCSALFRRQGRQSGVAAKCNPSARESGLVLNILAGPEIGLVLTKAFTRQLLVLAAIALEASRALSMAFWTNRRSTKVMISSEIEFDAGKMADTNSCNRNTSFVTFSVMLTVSKITGQSLRVSLNSQFGMVGR